RRLSQRISCARSPARALQPIVEKPLEESDLRLRIMSSLLSVTTFAPFAYGDSFDWTGHSDVYMEPRVGKVYDASGAPWGLSNNVDLGWSYLLAGKPVYVNAFGRINNIDQFSSKAGDETGALLLDGF